MNLPHPSAENLTPLVDTDQYRRMFAALDDSFPSIVSRFFNETERFASSLASLEEKKDSESCQKLCHEIRGAASSLGFCGISSLAAECEEKSKERFLPRW